MVRVVTSTWRYVCDTRVEYALTRWRALPVELSDSSASCTVPESLEFQDGAGIRDAGDVDELVLPRLPFVACVLRARPSLKP